MFRCLCVLTPIIKQRVPDYQCQLKGSKTNLNLTLSSETVASLDDVCERKKVLRDSFINRLLFFLVLRPRAINTLYPWLKECIEPLGERLGYEKLGLHTHGLGAAASALGDPFEFYRACVDFCVEVDGEGAPAKTFYQLQIPVGPFERLDDFKKDAPFLHGLNCYMPDYLIPDTKAYLESRKMADELLKELDPFSSLLPDAADTSGTEEVQEDKE